MANLTLRASGSASPELAWRRYAQPALWSTWSPQIRRVETAAGRIAPGVAGRVVGPVGVRISFVVDTVDELERTWSWTVRFGPVRLVLEHGVTERGDGSATWLRVHGPIAIVAGYAPVAALALRRLVAA